jgi:hypothetical protein
MIRSSTMNERFLELAKQTDEFFKKEGRSFFRYNWNEKFAELIVRECMNKTAGYLLEDEFADTDVKEASEELSKHFGVELWTS